MFEFGRDLKRLFDGHRPDQDLGWLELVDVGLLEAEARRQTIDSGRASCSRPHAASLLAASLWREHARRSGTADSLQKARLAALDARKASRNNDERAEAVLSLAECMVLGFDLHGGPESLNRALSIIRDVQDQASRPALQARMAAVHAMARARRVSCAGEDGMEAMAFLDQAIHDLSNRPGLLRDEVRLDRAGLTLAIGIERRDARLLDQAGRDLRALIDDCPEDQRPLTRARALALCGAGLSALAALADNADAAEQGRALFDAASDQFMPDHSPMDWAAVSLARAAHVPGAACLGISPADIEALRPTGTLLALALTDAESEARVREAEAEGDLHALDRLAARLRSRLALDRPRPVAWATDQIGLARIAIVRGRLLGQPCGPVRLVLVEASCVAREEGASLIADRAQTLMRQIAD